MKHKQEHYYTINLQNNMLKKGGKQGSNFQPILQNNFIYLLVTKTKETIISQKFTVI